MRLLLALAFLLVAAAPAHADPFGELPFHAVHGAATCVRATGAPGEVARWTEDGFELLRADAAGLTPAATVKLGRAAGCPSFAGQPSGAAIAALVSKGGARVVLRDPGGGFGTPVRLPIPAELEDIAVAVSPRGDAVVALLVSQKRSARVLAYRRAPGGAFGKPERVAELAVRPFFAGIEAGIDGAGRVTLAWSGEGASIGTPVETASALSGVAFGTASRIGTAAPSDDEPSLSVAPDGRALIAYESEDTGVTVAERPPGEERFGAPASVVPGRESALGTVALALADGGAAVVAWHTEGLKTSGGVRVSTRAAAGPFGAPRDVAPGRPLKFGFGESFSLVTSSGPPQDDPRLQAAIAGSGALLTWPEPSPGAVYGAAGALAGGPFTRAPLGGPVRPAVSLAPLVLADGRAAVVWADDDLELGVLPTGHGRLHLAAAGAPPAADAPAPRVTVLPQPRQTLRVDEPILVRLRCAAACDVHAATSHGRRSTEDVASRASAGRLTLKIVGFGLLTRRTTRVAITLRASAPGARTSRTQRIRVPLRVRPSPPLPPLLDVRVRRSGDDLVVTWRTSFVARRAVFDVVAVGSDDVLATRDVRPRGRRSFRVTLRGAAAAHRVIVTAFGGSDVPPRHKTVDIR